MDHANVEFSGSDVIIRIPKAILVMTREQFVQALLRGKAYRRAQARAARVRDPRDVHDAKEKLRGGSLP